MLGRQQIVSQETQAPDDADCPCGSRQRRYCTLRHCASQSPECHRPTGSSGEQQGGRRGDSHSEQEQQRHKGNLE